MGDTGAQNSLRGAAWGELPDAARQEELAALLERQRQWLQATSPERRDLTTSAFRGVALRGADLYWLAMRVLCDDPTVRVPASSTPVSADTLAAGSGETFAAARDRLRGASTSAASGTATAPIILDALHIEGADLRNAWLDGAILTGAHLSGARLRYAHLAHAQLVGAHLEHADLTGATLRDASLVDASMAEAILTDADLRGVRLAGATLRAADLSRADLSRAVFEKTQLKGATLVHTNLRQSNVMRDATGEADLRAARLDLPTRVNRRVRAWRAGQLPKPRRGPEAQS